MVPASPNFIYLPICTSAIPKGLTFGLCLYVLRLLCMVQPVDQNQAQSGALNQQTMGGNCARTIDATPIEPAPNNERPDESTRHAMNTGYVNSTLHAINTGYVNSTKETSINPMPDGVIVGDSGLCCYAPRGQCVTSITSVSLFVQGSFVRSFIPLTSFP